MIRNLAIAIAAVATIGAASLASTAPASAGWKGHSHHHTQWGHHGHHHHHKHWGHKVYGVAPVVVVGSGYGCWRKQWVETAYGPVLRRVNVCY